MSGVGAATKAHSLHHALAQLAVWIWLQHAMSYPCFGLWILSPGTFPDKAILEDVRCVHSQATVKVGPAVGCCKSCHARCQEGCSIGLRGGQGSHTRCQEGCSSCLPGSKGCRASCQDSCSICFSGSQGSCTCCQEGFSICFWSCQGSSSLSRHISQTSCSQGM